MAAAFEIVVGQVEVIGSVFRLILDQEQPSCTGLQ
jgi:hypothetical protein